MRPPNRRTVLLGLATSALWAGCRASRGIDPRVDGALQRAQSWLWAQQAADGAAMWMLTCAERLTIHSIFARGLYPPAIQ